MSLYAAFVKRVLQTPHFCVEEFQLCLFPKVQRVLFLEVPKEISLLRKSIEFCIPQNIAHGARNNGIPFYVNRPQFCDRELLPNVGKYVPLHAGLGPKILKFLPTSLRNPLKSLRKCNYFNPLALELDIYSLAHHLCKMCIFYEPRRVTLGATWHFVEE